jgi:hypothetical protein
MYLLLKLNHHKRDWRKKLYLISYLQKNGILITLRPYRKTKLCQGMRSKLKSMEVIMKTTTRLKVVIGTNKLNLGARVDWVLKMFKSNFSKLTKMFNAVLLQKDLVWSKQRQHLIKLFLNLNGQILVLNQLQGNNLVIKP